MSIARKTQKSIKCCCLSSARLRGGWYGRSATHVKLVTQSKQIPQTVYTRKHLRDLWRSDGPSAMRFFVNIRTFSIRQRLRHASTLSQAGKVPNCITRAFRFGSIKVAVVEEMFALDLTAILRQFLLSNIAAMSARRVYVQRELYFVVLRCSQFVMQTSPADSNRAACRWENIALAASNDVK